MKISCTYSGFKSHSGILNGDRDLEISINEIFHAAYTVGKQNRQEVYAHPYYSMKEKGFRISMLKAFLDFNKEYIRRSSIFNNLDPSEKGAINYFLGNVFSKLIAQKEFQVRWLIHLDLFDGDYKLVEKHKKRPDFVGRQEHSSWIAVESKSRQYMDPEVKSKAFEQLKNLNTIDSVAPSFKLASILLGKDDEYLHLDIIDPDENEGIMLKIDEKEYDYVRDYYALIYLLIKEGYEMRNINGRDFATRTIYCDEVVLGLDLYIYESIDNSTVTSYITKDIEKYLNEKNKEFGVKLRETQDYFVGLDGVYVSYLGNKS